MEPIVITRAPLSITLGDQEVYKRDRRTPCRQIIRAAINYYAYTIITHGPDDGVHIIWAGLPASRCQQCGETLGSEMELALPEAISKRFNIRDGLTIFLAPQAPLSGGLGLAGSLAVSMIKALAFCSGLDLEPGEAADLACQIETGLLKTSAINGDPYAAAYGGVSNTTFCSRSTTVDVLHLSEETLRVLERSLMLYHMDGSLSSISSPLSERIKHQVWETTPAYTGPRSKPWIVDIRAALEKGNLTTFGQMLHHAWQDTYQKSDNGSYDLLTQCYGIARASGALGGRGEVGVGHSFLTLYCLEEDQPGVAAALAAMAMQRWPIKLVSEGVEILEVMPRTWSKIMKTTSLIPSM